MSAEVGVGEALLGQQPQQQQQQQQQHPGPEGGLGLFHRWFFSPSDPRRWRLFKSLRKWTRVFGFRPKFLEEEGERRLGCGDKSGVGVAASVVRHAQGI